MRDDLSYKVTFSENILENQKGKMCFTNMRHRWYLFINKNIKERVNFINLIGEFHCMHFKMFFWVGTNLNRNTQGELVAIFPSLSLLSNTPQRECVCVHVLNTFLFSLGMMGNFCFSQVPSVVAGNFYHFKNEGYLHEVFLTKLCLYIFSKIIKRSQI